MSLLFRRRNYRGDGDLDVRSEGGRNPDGRDRSVPGDDLHCKVE